MQDLWRLETTYTVQCVCCSQCEDASKPTQEDAIKALQSIGWLAHEIGAWCPDCAPLLTARRSQRHSLKVGDIVCDHNHKVLGPVIRVGEGYVEVKVSDGISTHCICDVSKAKEEKK